MKVFDDNVMVCIDCALYIANGDLPDDNPQGWAPEQLENLWRGYDLCTGDSAKDEDFSWHGCDGCGSPLGGQRMHCVALKSE